VILAPLAWNALTGATVSTDAEAFQRGCPASNLWDSDPRKLCLSRGQFTVTAATNDSVEFDDGSAQSTTVAAGLYNSPAEVAIAIAAAMNAVSSAWQVYWIQGSTNRYRFVVKRTTGTGALTIATDDDSVFKHLLGFRDADRSAAATHTGDYAVTSAPRDSVLVDLTTAKPADCTFLAYPQLSPGGVVRVCTGTTTACSDSTDVVGDSADSECLYLGYAATRSARYVRLDLSDSRRHDAPRAGAGYWYHGPVWDSLEWDVESYQRSLEPRYAANRSLTGQLYAGEVAPVERVRVAFTSGAGLEPRDAHEAENLLAALGINGLVFVALDPTYEPHRESMLARLTAMPSLERVAAESPAGRWRLTLEFERVPVL